MVEELLIKLAKNLKIGIAHRGVLHHSDEESVSLDDWFNEISLSNAFDYVDKTPPKKDFNQYKKLSEKYNLPFYLVAGFIIWEKKIDLILENLKMGAELGSKYHNVQIFINHADGHELTDQEIA